MIIPKLTISTYRQYDHTLLLDCSSRKNFLRNL